jgi:hypothetical protein
MSKTQEPKILSSPASGKYYLVTKYKTAGEGFSAIEKIDITDEVQQLLVKERLDEASRALEPSGKKYDVWREDSCEHDAYLPDRIKELGSQLNKEKSV